MGHIRLGRLAKTASWQYLVRLLDLPEINAARVAVTTADGAQAQLHAMRHDPVLTYCFWLMTRLATAARSDNLVEQAGHWGLDLSSNDSALSVVTKLNDLVRQEIEAHPESGPFAEIASLAFRRTLLETLAIDQRRLFDSTAGDLEQAIRGKTTDRGFANLAVRFFGDLLGRTLRFYVDKELPFHIGADSGFRDIAATDDFLRELDVYARQSARIVDAFASEWLSKYTYQEQGMISREQAQGFVAHAMDKLDAELRLEAVA